LNEKSAVVLWVLAVLCNLVTLPFSPGMAQQFERSRNPVIFLLLGFNLIGAILIVKAARASIRRRRFGETYFEFDTLPFSTGERVRGRIHLQFDARAEHGIDLRLSCVRRVVSGSGENSTTNQIILWQSDQNVPSGALAPGPLGSAIPVDFSIPADTAITNHDNPLVGGSTAARIGKWQAANVACDLLAFECGQPWKRARAQCCRWRS